MKKMHIAVGGITNTIYIGTILRNGLLSAHKTDITIMALDAVASHVLRHKERTGENVILTYDDGTEILEIIVNEINKAKK